MVVHGASDAFPPLKSALEGILEIWKQCEVRPNLLYNIPSPSKLLQRTAEAEDEFGKIKSKLELLMKIADTYAKNPQETTTVGLSERLESLSRYVLRSTVPAYLNQSHSQIGQLRSSVESKLGRERLAEAAKSRVDVRDIKILVGAITSILDEFHVRSRICRWPPPSDIVIAREWCGGRDEYRRDYERYAGTRSEAA